MNDLENRLQVTPLGVAHYYDLTNKLDQLSRPLSREFKALQSIIVIHPLDYIPLRGLPTPVRADYLSLIRKGYVREVENSFSYLIGVLDRYDPSLLPVVQTYNKIAHREAVSSRELNLALRALTNRLKEEESYIEKRRIESAKRLKEIGGPTLPNLPNPASEVLKEVGVPKTRTDQVIALDTAMSRLHFDPDLLRTLPKSHQPIVGQSIKSWLNQLAGGPK